MLIQTANGVWKSDLSGPGEGQVFVAFQENWDLLDANITAVASRLTKASNLSDLTNPITARDNLGLGLVDSGIVTTSYLLDAEVAQEFSLTVNADFFLDCPFNGTDGRRLTIRIYTTAAANISFHYKFRFNPDVPPSAIVLGNKNILVIEYDSVDDRWDVIAFRGSIPLTLTVAIESLSPVLSWYMNDPTTSIADHSGLGHTGTAVGATLQQPTILPNEPFMKSITGGFVTTPHAADLLFTSFTMVARLSPVYGGAFQAVMSKTSAGGSEEWTIYFNGLNSNILYFIAGAASTTIALPPPAGVPLLLICDYDGTNFRVFYDNVLQSSVLYGVAIPAHTGNVGTCFRDDYGESLGGFKGPHALFNRVLTSPERALLQRSIL